MMFTNRFDAAHKLVEKLQKYKNNKDVVVLAIPRGGVQVGSIVAKELKVKLDIVLTKKISSPNNQEYAIGAVSLNRMFINEEHTAISQEYISEEVKKIRERLQQRYRQYCVERKPTSLKHKIVIIADDGVATGSTMLAAIELVKREKPQKIIVAIPVGPGETIERLRTKADEMICLLIPDNFYAIGQFYIEFPQVEDEEAIRLLNERDSKG